MRPHGMAFGFQERGFAMLNRLREWFGLDRPLSGGNYALIGLVAFAIKFNCDKLFAKLVFHRSWELLDYLKGSNAFYLWDLRQQDAAFFAGMLGLAVPFMAFGVAMTKIGRASCRERVEMSVGGG